MSSEKDKSQLKKSRTKKLQQLKKHFTKDIDVEALFEQITQGDVQALSTGLTLIESKKKEDKLKALKLIELSIPNAGNSFRIGISGTPGAGKSTFINKVGCKLIEGGNRVAVLTIDPSSNSSQGSILGDKTRMTDLSISPQAYIRPSPTGKTLGGVALSTRESILLCEAAGYNSILIETVGVGQSEVEVQTMVDFYTVLLIPGSGDELQGIKRGIIELADLIIVNKSDGDNVVNAEITMANYKRAIHLFPPKKSEWIPKVITASAEADVNLDLFLNLANEFKQLAVKNGYLETNRKYQRQVWYEKSISNILDQLIHERPEIVKKMEVHKQMIAENKIPPPTAAHEILDLFINA